MIGRRAIVGLSLLSALVFCAFAASSALATEGPVTAFECAAGEGEVGFKDAHCTEATSVKAEVKFKHVSIEKDKATEVTATNKETTNKTKQSTPAVMNVTLAGLPVEFICAEVTGTGSLTNNSKEPMSVTGEATIEYKECMMPLPRSAEGVTKCKVKEPIAAQTKLRSTDNEATKEVGVTISPKEVGKPFVEITLENNGATVCPIKATYKVEGEVTARVNGATGTIETGKHVVEGKEVAELTVGGQEAFLSKTATVKMKGGNPIAATTTTTP